MFKTQCRRLTYSAPGRAFDAAGSSGFNFLQSQLEKVDTDLVKPLQAVTHPRDIPVELGGGFPEIISAWASNYGSTGTQFYGLQGTNNTEIPIVQADLQKGIWKTFIWSAGMVVTYLDLQKMETAKRLGMPAPVTLQQLYEDGVASLWVKALDYVTYNGFLGLPGLINNSAVPESVVANGASGHSAWSTKTANEILTDINTACNTCMANSGYDSSEGMPDSMLIPYTQYSLITLPMTLGSFGGAGFVSIKDYIEKSCVAAHHGVPFTINSLPNPWISGAGTGGLDRGVIYRKDKKSLYLAVPQPMQKAMTVPTMRAGGAYETGYFGCVSQVIFKRTTNMLYADGI
jgi:hypothetical protein